MVNYRLTGDYYTRQFTPHLSEDGHTLVLNVGPQHAATHGVLRVIVELDGEYIRRAEPVPDVSQIFLAHDWPGNVRELENVNTQSLLPRTG